MTKRELSAPLQPPRSREADDFDDQPRTALHRRLNLGSDSERAAPYKFVKPAPDDRQARDCESRVPDEDQQEPDPVEILIKPLLGQFWRIARQQATDNEAALPLRLAEVWYFYAFTASSLARGNPELLRHRISDYSGLLTQIRSSGWIDPNGLELLAESGGLDFGGPIGLCETACGIERTIQRRRDGALALIVQMLSRCLSPLLMQKIASWCLQQQPALGVSSAVASPSGAQPAAAWSMPTAAAASSENVSPAGFAQPGRNGTPATEQPVGALEKRVAALETSIPRLEQRLATLNISHGTLKTSLDALAKRLDELMAKNEVPGNDNKDKQNPKPVRDRSGRNAAAERSGEEPPTGGAGTAKGEAT